jgi:co-chaperonin GroES (HSP10)
MWQRHVFSWSETQVVAVGPGPLDEDGERLALSVSAGSTVLYSKYAGSEFKGADGTNYIVLRASDLMAVLSWTGLGLEDERGAGAGAGLAIP